jgi:hypothetical protein
MEHIHDIDGYIEKRLAKGKTVLQISQDLQDHGYDLHAARGLILLHMAKKEDSEDAR